MSSFLNKIINRYNETVFFTKNNIIGTDKIKDQLHMIWDNTTLNSYMQIWSQNRDLEKNIVKKSQDISQPTKSLSNMSDQIESRHSIICRFCSVIIMNNADIKQNLRTSMQINNNNQSLDTELFTHMNTFQQNLSTIDSRLSDFMNG